MSTSGCRKRVRKRWLALCALLLAAPADAAEVEDYTGLDLDALAALSAEVTAVSRKRERLVEAPAAAYVVSAEDIRRSGLQTLPEVLRLVPGLHVARISASRWAITARGFNYEYANKLLVMVDGRTVYTPTFSGVYWNLQEMPLSDIERIEVVRGPGATQWGANAVNGVIHIVTRHAGEDPGSRAELAVGTEDRFIGTLRHAGRLREGLDYRISTRAYAGDASADLNGHANGDDWRLQRFDGRLDWQASDRDTVSVHASLHHGDQGNTVRTLLASSFVTGQPLDTRESADNNGGSGTLRWTRTLADEGSTTLQLYYDQLLQREDFFEEARHTIDVDFQHRWPLTEGRELIWGTAYRGSRFRVSNSRALSFTDDSDTDALYNGFVQLEQRWLDDRLRLLVGSKAGWNTSTGWEFQPSARGTWLITPNQQLWASISRAVRTPSNAERLATVTLRVLPPNALFLGSPATPVQITLSNSMEAETVLAYELGYRIQAGRRLSVDVAAFWNRYRRVIASRNGANAITQVITNGNPLRTYGAEVAADWKATGWLRLQATYSALNASSAGTFNEVSPHHQGRLSAAVDLPANVELDTSLYLVGRTRDSFGTRIDGYQRFDVRLGWRPAPTVGLDLIGQNLFDRRHPEALSLLSPQTRREVERAVLARITLAF